MKNILIIAGAVALLLVGGSLWSKSLHNSDPNIVATGGMHWHPQLAIYIKGVKQEIPANLGLGAVEHEIHTHADDSAQGVIHLEFEGMVRKEDIMLGQFFKVWGKDMRSFGSNMHMSVNGKENTEYENYVMHDGDRIELRYD